jgi:transposase-like protein
MGTQVRLIVKRRNYSKEFKLELVSLFEKGKFSVSQLGKLYGVCPTMIYHWIYKFSRFNEKGCRVIEMKQSSISKIKELEQKIRDLERLVGQKQIKIDFLEQVIEVANEELNTDIKKKSSTPPSGDYVKKAKS